MPKVKWTKVPETEWKTWNTSDWDGKTVVWLNDTRSKISIQIPVISKNITTTYNDYTVPSYSTTIRETPIARQFSEILVNFDKYTAYMELSNDSKIGQGINYDYVGATTVTNSFFYWNNETGEVGNWIAAGSPQITAQDWDIHGGFFLAAKKSDSTNAVDGYDIYMSGPKIIQGNIINKADFTPVFGLIPFGDKTKFPNGPGAWSISENEGVYDPYNPGGTTPTDPGGTGGNGDFDGETIDIGIPDAPSISSAATGFITLFNPTQSQLSQLASYMWSDVFDIETFKKLFADPMQAILGLSIIPGPIPAVGSAEVKVGNISTGISMNKAAQQYITVDCGSLNVNEYWGAYLDYDPYTKCEIYLPYIGTHAIAADDIMGKTVQVVYRVDILTGACMAYIKCGGSVLYQFAGQCATSIPITGNDWTNVINGTLSIAASIGSMVATGGATAPMAATALANTAVNQMKPSVEKSGSLSGAAGIMGIQQPYLIVTRPRQALPYKQNTYTGYPSLYSVNLSELTGYTEIEKIHLEGIPATEKELTEIDTLLKGGVIF